MGLFGINTVSDISKFTKISRAAAAASNIWRVLKYREWVFISNTPKRNFALYVTGVILHVSISNLA